MTQPVLLTWIGLPVFSKIGRVKPGYTGFDAYSVCRATQTGHLTGSPVGSAGPIQV